MNQKNREPRTQPDAEDICLGLVITAAFQRREQAIHKLQEFWEVELGTPSGNRIPACVISPRGQDRELIRSLEAIPDILRVEVAFAQVIEEEVV